MAKVLIFNNFLKKGQKSVLEPQDSFLNEYISVGPGRWQANPYGKSKHITKVDLLKRIIACIKLWIHWYKYDVLIVDSAITGFFVSTISLLGKGRRKLIISSFTLPRHRRVSGGGWRELCTTE